MTVTTRPIWTGSTTAVYSVAMVANPAAATPFLLLYVLAVLLPMLPDVVPAVKGRTPVPLPAGRVRPYDWSRS